MIRHELGDELFFHVLRAYLAEHAFSTASANDFKEVLEKESGRDFSDYFEQWFYGQGFPIIDIKWFQNNDTLILDITQEPTASQITPLFNLHLDLKIDYLGGDTLIQVRFDTHSKRFEIPIKKRVSGITPDPDRWLIAEFRSVVHQSKNEKDSFFAIFPNPVRHEVYIQSYEIGSPFSVKLYNTQGNQVKYGNGIGAFLAINMEDLPEGNYQLVVIRDNIKEVYSLTKI
jgi:hypothetical protein